MKRRPGHRLLGGASATKAGVASGKLPGSFRKASGEFCNAPFQFLYPAKTSGANGNPLGTLAFVVFSSGKLPDSFRELPGQLFPVLQPLYVLLIIIIMFRRSSGNLPGTSGAAEKTLCFYLEKHFEVNALVF